MIDRDKARALVKAELVRMREKHRLDEELVIEDDMTIETEFGWVFFYDAKKFLETREFRDRLLGNAPIIVDKYRGTLHMTGTARPIEEYIREFVEARRLEEQVGES
jgi:hypothetical protein